MVPECSCSMATLYTKVALTQSPFVSAVDVFFISLYVLLFMEYILFISPNRKPVKPAARKSAAPNPHIAIVFLGGKGFTT